MQSILIVIKVLLIGLILTTVNANPIDSNTKAAVNVVSRTEWGGRQPQQAPKPLDILPAPYAIISHTATQVCLSTSACPSQVRNIQNYHMSTLKYDDIGYSFLVGGDGVVYVGRGWDVVGAHSKGYNSKSIGIAFIGSFDIDQPTEAQLEAAKGLLELGVSENKLAKDYKLIGHKQVSQTQSPGKNVYNVIKTWEHWVERP